jgi:hypothetical protein
MRQETAALRDFDPAHVRFVGALNSTHIHGTSVPVEEPSTASIADIVLFNHLVG